MKKQIKFKKTDPLAILPSKKNVDDAGYDVVSIEEATIPAKAQQVFRTGIELVDCPKDIVLQAWSRSGLDSKFALHVGAGIIDSGYRGEILICLKNMSTVEYTVKVGDKIAQLVPVTLGKVDVIESEEVSQSSRGKTGGITEFKTQQITFLDEEPE